MQTLNNLYRGDTEPIILTFRDENSNLIDLTGDRVRITMKVNESDINTVLQVDAVISDQTTNKGEAVLTLTPTDTEIEPKRYYYDIEWKTSAGNITTLIKSTVEVLTDITRV